MICSVCKNEISQPVLKVREMMFGIKDEFNYHQCDFCGCLQIDEIPGDLSKYYPENYYSFEQESQKESGLKSFVRKNKFDYAVFNHGVLGKLVYNFFPDERFYALRFVDQLQKNDRILDVGCGSGFLIKGMNLIGFSNLVGIDPFVQKDTKINEQVHIYKKYLSEALQDLGKFDLVMLHHSFEHMADPASVFMHIRDLLLPEGTCMIRIPVADSYAFEHYRENWVQLDAPRHLFLHTNKSMQILAKNAGLKISQIIDDSNPLQFWGSEQYLKDLPLMNKKSLAHQKLRKLYPSIRKYNSQSKKLNQKGLGDQRIYMIKKLQ